MEIVPRSKRDVGLQEEVMEIVPRSKWDVGLQEDVMELVPRTKGNVGLQEQAMELVPRTKRSGDVGIKEEAVEPVPCPKVPRSDYLRMQADIEMDDLAVLCEGGDLKPGEPGDFYPGQTCSPWSLN
jgi:hypothetical protein